MSPRTAAENRTSTRIQTFKPVPEADAITLAVEVTPSAPPAADTADATGAAAIAASAPAAKSIESPGSMGVITSPVSQKTIKNNIRYVHIP